MEEDVEMTVDVEMGELQGSRQGELEVRVVRSGGRRPRWEAAREGSVIVDVEFEEVEEGVRESRDGAVYILNPLVKAPDAQAIS